MQDRYAGDIGDYIKLALLRDDRRLGIGWYKMPDEVGRNDGRHVGYLGLDRDGRPVDPDRAAAEWRGFDPTLYDGLRRIVVRQSRKVAELIPLLPAETVFHDELVARHDRDQWFAAMRDSFKDCDLVFVDPDNGIEPGGYKAGSAKAGKSITHDEILQLRAGARSLVVYHHQTHFVGGHRKEIEEIGAELKKRGIGSIGAIRAKSFSPRVFFLLGFDHKLWQRAVTFTKSSGEKLEFFPIDEPLDSLGLPASSPYGERAEDGLIAFGRQVDAGEYDRFVFPNGRQTKL
jgi:hypothetical protein